MADAAYNYKHQQSRKRWDEYLARVGPVPCRCGCGNLVYCDAQAEDNIDGRKFQLGHGVAVVNGGDGSDSAPEIATHNLSNGGRLGNARAQAPRVSRGWGTVL